MLNKSIRKFLNVNERILKSPTPLKNGNLPQIIFPTKKNKNYEIKKNKIFFFGGGTYFMLIRSK